MIGRLLFVASLLVAVDATARAQTPSPEHRFFQIAPYLGVHSYRGDSGTNVGPGIHVGGLIGFRLGELFSINAEAAVDSVDYRAAGTSSTELDLVVTLSPLVSVPAGKVDLVFGPKLGTWDATYNQSSASSHGSGSGSFSGYDLGTSFATITKVGRKLRLGVLASFDLRLYRKSCFTPSYGIEGCTSTDLPAADKVVSLAILLLYST